MVEVLKRAHAHQGAAFVEIFQNCVVFNDGVFDEFTAREVAPIANVTGFVMPWSTPCTRLIAS